MAKKTLKQKRANPKWRANLRDEDLTPEQLAKRRLNTRLNAPFVPGGTQTYRDIAREREASTQLRYGGVESQLAQQQQRIPAYFQEYMDTVKTQNALAQGRYEGAQQQIAAQQQQALGRDQAERDRIGQQRQADAASRGATAAPDIQGSEAALSRAGMQDTFANLIRSQGLAEQDYGSARLGVGAAAKLSEGLKLAALLKDLESEKGAYRTDYMSRARESEGKSVLENLLFGEKVRGAEQTEAGRREERRLKRSKARSEAEKDAYQREHGLGPYKPPAAPKPSTKDKYGNTQASRREAKRKWAKAQSLAKSFAQPGDDPAEIYQFLQTKLDADPDILRAAAELATRGRIGRKRYDRLARLGVPGVPKPVKATYEGRVRANQVAGPPAP